MKSWYLVHTKIRQEAVALANLQRQGFECFLPLIWVEKLRRGNLQVVQEPLFPRYLFIRLGMGAHTLNLGGEPGQRVIVNHGPFVGIDAIYQMADGENRVMVLLNILSKDVKLVVPPSAILQAA